MSLMVERVGFSGSREGLSGEQHVAVNQILTRLKVWGATFFHHGDCVGGDSEAHNIAYALDYRISIHPPTRREFRAFRTARSGSLYEPKPYMTRNEDIVRMTQLLIACPEGDSKSFPRSGTWATIRRARKKGIPVIVVYPDGERERTGSTREELETLA